MTMDIEQSTLYVDLKDILVSSDLQDSGLVSNTPNNQTISDRYKFIKSFQLVFLIALFTGTVIGNLALLVAVGKSRTNKRSRTLFFITHLAVADLCVAVFSVLTEIIWKLTEQWYAGLVMCLLVRYLQAVVTYAATYVLVALSLDRLDAIARPMRFIDANFRAKILVCLAWASALVFSIPMLFINKYIVDYDGNKYCRVKLGSRRNWQIYLSLISAAVFIIPAGIIIACYVVIIYVIWSRSQVGINPAGKQKSNLIRLCRLGRGSDELKETRPIARERRNTSCSGSTHGVIPQAKIRSVKMTFVIVTVFILCWSPYFVYDLLDVYELLPSVDISVSVFIQSLTTLNCFMNPFIYGIFITNVCRNIEFSSSTI